MAPKAPITAASRRAKRIVESASPGSSPVISGTTSAVDAGEDVDEGEEEVDEDVDAEGEEDEDAEGDEEDAEGEEEDDEEEEDFVSAPASRIDSDMEDDIPQPPSALRIKLKLNARSSRPPLPPAHPNASSSTGGRRPVARVAATKSKSKSKKVAEEESDDDDEDELMLGDDDDIGLGDDGMGEEEDAEGEVEGGQSGAGADEDDELGSDGESRRSVSPSKMTARQRGRGDVDLQETLLALPMDPGNKKLVLTEAEKEQRREETARKRKRQSEQKAQDEQEQTINRLLRAQTTRSRNKLDVPSPGEDGTPSSRVSPRRTLRMSNSIRYTSSIVGDNVVLKVGVPKGKEEWVRVGENLSKRDTIRRDASAQCAVEGCEEKRKYRCVKKFEVGGCSLAHLKLLNEAL